MQVEVFYAAIVPTSILGLPVGHRWRAIYMHDKGKVRAVASAYLDIPRPRDPSVSRALNAALELAGMSLIRVISWEICDASMGAL